MRSHAEHGNEGERFKPCSPQSVGTGEVSNVRFIQASQEKIK